MVISSFFAGADIITFFAPALICFEAPSFSVNLPVDSTTISTPKSFHGSCEGSDTANTLRGFPLTEIVSPCAFTSASRLPRMESYFKRCVSVFASVISFTATNSISFVFKDALKRFLPILPKPFIPTFIAIRPPIKKELRRQKSESRLQNNKSLFWLLYSTNSTSLLHLVKHFLCPNKDLLF